MRTAACGAVAAPAVTVPHFVVRIVLTALEVINDMMRKRFAFLGVLALVLALVPSVGFALDIWPNGSYWAGVPYDEPGYYAAFVRADNRYDAAVYGLGLDPAVLSADTKLKLSDPSYGGNFYKYAMTFENVSGWDDMPEWLPAYVMMGTIGLGQSFERIYASKTTSALRTSALADYETVVSGGDLGGGSGSVVPLGEYLSVPLFAWADDEGSSTANKDIYRFSAQNAIFSDGSLIIENGTTKFSPWSNNSYYVSHGVFYASNELLSVANGYINQGYDVVFCIQHSNRCGLLYGHNLSLSYAQYSKESYKSYIYTGSDMHVGYFDCSYYYNSSDGVFSFVPTFDSFDASAVTGSFFRSYYMSQVYDVPFSAPPSGEWPEPTVPVTPDPPDLPTPTAPTETVDPNPTAPTITWPTAPTLVLPTSPVVDTTPEGIDYTALLTLINDNLNSIDAYLQNFYSSFNSFRSDFLNGIDDIVDGLRNIYQYLGHLNNILEVHCKHITDQIEESVYNLELYLKRLFEWLPKQLNFDAEFDYDDSAVTTLLHRILNKIPGGSTGTPVSYKPNPQSDEPGFFDFLADLWHRFLIDLVSVLPDELGGLVDTISQLTHYFPFSIPWDMFALLGLFAHDPVTPVFDVPWGYGGDEGEVQLIRVDLSAWDGVMETVRPVFLVGFCMQLAMITKDLLANFDLKQGGV